MTKRLYVRNWKKNQSYRADRGQPPWIKVHRKLLRNWDWIELTDAERGQLLSIWILAADNEGEVPSSPRQIQKLCYMHAEPDVNKLIELGFLEWRHVDANLTSGRQQHDRPEAETETETETEGGSSSSSEYSAREADSTPDENATADETDFQRLTSAMASAGFRHEAVHKPKPIALLREWVAQGVTVDDVQTVAAMLRERDHGKNFSPGYMAGPMSDYLEAKRNGNAQRWRSGSKGNAAAGMHDYLKRKAAESSG